ncbi:YebC/PmpR family DNA-binding transcriptional regulator [Patescibacteria group bacterium]
MSGHSRWSQIKRQKGVQDAKRGTLFTKLGKTLTVTARAGGVNPATNERLRLAIDQARSLNMPNTNIERAIKRGTGELNDGEIIEEVVYEGYGPGGAAIMIQVLTNNKNRTIADLRHIFSRHGGNLATQNSVNWMFESRGVITIDVSGNDNEEIQLAAIDAGAEDVEEGSPETIIYTTPTDLKKVSDALTAKKYKIIETAIELVAKNKLAVNEGDSKKLEKLLADLQANEDVNNFYTNAEA